MPKHHFHVALIYLLLELWQVHIAYADRVVACLGSAYLDCQDYCRDHGGGGDVECIYKCGNGCGPKDGYIVRNNGGCHKIEDCPGGDNSDDDEDQQAESVQETEPPTTTVDISKGYLNLRENNNELLLKAIVDIPDDGSGVRHAVAKTVEKPAEIPERRSRKHG
ncbi:uncharacterized protein LOC115634631 [Scaptodrosophila lebanonensis]|uniref:Uncharacterized protein LOC115634631 n=1 Tax=Drosophila lebanonensis TaxID=7225 RepID=A0A6J2UM90_DROLE|nr:uncharacterized protein LOC115634631 [Scaptodrosophila lebanonensis]